MLQIDTFSRDVGGVNEQAQRWLRQAKVHRLRRSNDISKYKVEGFNSPEEVVSLRKCSPMLFLVAQRTQN